jgi:hypothetical protein
VWCPRIWGHWIELRKRTCLRLNLLVQRQYRLSLRRPYWQMKQRPRRLVVSQSRTLCLERVLISSDRCLSCLDASLLCDHYFLEAKPHHAAAGCPPQRDGRLPQDSFLAQVLHTRMHLPPYIPILTQIRIYVVHEAIVVFLGKPSRASVMESGL